LSLNDPFAVTGHFLDTGQIGLWFSFPVFPSVFDLAVLVQVQSPAFLFVVRDSAKC
jgi:hypothetical protein